MNGAAGCPFACPDNARLDGAARRHAAVKAGEPVEVGADSVASSSLGASVIGTRALAVAHAHDVGLALPPTGV